MSRPGIRELECFVAVADYLNFSRAARHLNLSQPPLTRHIKALEEKLGSKLFERNTHSVALTDGGRLFLEDAHMILGQLDRASETIRRARHGETMRLRLAFIGALLDEKLVRLIRLFREDRPMCQVQVTDLSPAAQLDAIEEGQLDGGFIGAKPTKYSKNIAFAFWGSEPLILALPDNHELTRVRVLHWKHLDGLPWVIVSHQAAPAFRQQFSALVKEHQLSARIVQESDRVPAVLTMVAAGSGVTMVPQAVTHLIPKGVCFRKLPAPQPLLHHAFAYPSRGASKPLREFLALLQNMEPKAKSDRL